MASQLNIKDGETVRLAKQLAARRGQPVTAYLRDMLRRQDEADRADEDEARKTREEEWARKLELIDELTKPIAEAARKLGMTSDHRWIYEDEDGDPLW